MAPPPNLPQRQEPTSLPWSVAEDHAPALEPINRDDAILLLASGIGRLQIPPMQHICQLLLLLRITIPEWGARLFLLVDTTETQGCGIIQPWRSSGDLGDLPCFPSPLVSAAAATACCILLF